MFLFCSRKVKRTIDGNNEVHRSAGLVRVAMLRKSRNKLSNARWNENNIPALVGRWGRESIA